jgi:mono/diheme cytochrome c family protein
MNGASFPSSTSRFSWGQTWLGALGLAAFAFAGLPAAAQSTNPVASAPVYVPNVAHANQPLKNGFLAWDAEQKTLEVTNGQEFAHFAFSFTNVSSGPVTILGARGSCSCTTIKLPAATPWLVATGGIGNFDASINLAGKAGMLYKAAIVTTDQGTKSLMLVVKIPPEPPPKPMTEAERAAGVSAAKLDRQAVFKGECASCHAKNIPGRYGQQLFAATCAVCHEANPRASMVPDLHNLKDPTSEEFWRTWITSGKAGTLMPAFAASQGGPLTDFQISTLAAYLNQTIPSHMPPAAAK